MVLLLRSGAERRVAVFPGTGSSRIIVLSLLCHPDASRSLMPGGFPSPGASPEVGPACRTAFAFLLDPKLAVSTIFPGSHVSPDLALAGGPRRGQEKGGGGLRREQREAPTPLARSLTNRAPNRLTSGAPLFTPLMSQIRIFSKRASKMRACSAILAVALVGTAAAFAPLGIVPRVARRSLALSPSMAVKRKDTYEITYAPTQPLLRCMAPGPPPDTGGAGQ